MAKCLGNIQGIDWDGVQEQVNKYIPLQKALHSFDTPAIQVLERMIHFLKQQHKKILVDYKVRVLSAGECGCPIPGWHYDCVRHYWHPSKHEHHILYTNTDGTEILQGVKIIKASDGDIWEYGRELHRAPFMRVGTKRVLIRLTETDNI